VWAIASHRLRNQEVLKKKKMKAIAIGVWETPENTKKLSTKIKNVVCLFSNPLQIV